MLRSFPARTSSHNSRSRHGGAKFGAAAELHSKTTKSHAVKLSVRTTTGGAEIHVHYDDIFCCHGGKSNSGHLGDSSKC
jgi:hypothetical protein